MTHTNGKITPMGLLGATCVVVCVWLALIAINSDRDDDSYKVRHAIDAAEVGDKVEPDTLTVVCGNDADAFEVLYARKLAMSDHKRVHGFGDSWGAVKAGSAAREAAVRRSRSCEIIYSFSADPVLVERKQVSGKPGDLFQTVTYTLRQDENRFVVKVEQDDISPFKPVKRPKPVQQMASASAMSFF